MELDKESDSSGMTNHNKANQMTNQPSIFYARTISQLSLAVVIFGACYEIRSLKPSHSAYKRIQPFKRVLEFEK